MMDEFGNPLELRPLMNVGERTDPQGMNLQLCVAHELDPDEQYSVQAIVVVQGYSLCRKHLVTQYEN